MSNKWIKTCSKSDVSEEEPYCFAVSAEKNITIYKIDEEFFCTDDLCTHGNASLSEGFQDDGIIECPFHGGAFNIRTGEPTSYPCINAIRTYPVKIEDDTIMVAYDGE
jgi:nitrite reductase/ring-hydroxylating ferredoxin subunit